MSRKHEPYIRLKVDLIKNKIRIQDIASLLNISRGYLSRKINGDEEFTFEEVEKICDEHKISPELFRCLQ